MSQQYKLAAASAALDHVRPGMTLGIGTGSTAEEFIQVLAKAVAAGLTVRGVPTSRRSEELCRELGIALTTLDETPELDLTIDGADEIGPDLGLIKGAGGALLHEKIVAAASKRMIVIADHTKCVETLGRFALAIEVNRFGLIATARAIEAAGRRLGLAGRLEIRQRSGENFVTDGGHAVVDASFGLINDAGALSCALLGIPGVVEHGLFLGLADLAIVGGPDGVREIRASENHLNKAKA